ncbi:MULTISPECIES: nitroreductase family protein [Weeksella]|uniref:Nitroreductase n=1 Tax=Weeksella virosa (strain ATCC 43766 / DSM 16922 / JCM 21250 / CCUG 30538 / CDC 9751 / IAM 14551 / NBRC 16016 / NCTC 11634 / CL345/78) TaxID=865938 RepID=F0P1G0_WEEVC|nr:MULTISPECIES: nitroreductase family protein [Weeksella]ADX68674.1 nitroreductase [Weeksella virosa DSM 16922]MDK7375162.1 nitroreductase family protein [Weeksella virosa]MDK7675814.1 nitroreductase family protein [Weeksella virosa]OFM85308.1 NAD(P)H-dependent oxidoreductase [Weeksella sp. HMSC059D05]SUP55021.1 Oxygen-insensitive NAD(P)H nitroreductase [Weeksella virosa]
MSLIDSLKWRYATKKMNGKKVEQSLVEQIIEAAHLAPSSSGIQPFEIIVVSNDELKKQIQPIANNQTQIVDGSHLLIFASWDQYTDERIDFIFDHMDRERNLPENSSNDYKNSLKKSLFALTKEQQACHTAKQAYLSFGVAIAAAAQLRVDATPMEGFDNAALDTFLGLDKKGLKSQTILTLGHRATEGDWLQGLKKVRQPKEKFITVFE